MSDEYLEALGGGSVVHPDGAVGDGTGEENLCCDGGLRLIERRRNVSENYSQRERDDNDWVGTDNRNESSMSNLDPSLAMILFPHISVMLR